MKAHYTIPFFIPLRGCPYKCIFCDQNKITGKETAHPEDIAKTIQNYLSTIRGSASHIEVGFFGGTFTGLPINIQEEYLKEIRPFINDRKIHGIRLSTRPDFINDDILDILKKYNVTCIELGVQSMSDKVLKASKRGHTAKDTIKASKMILKKGFKLGHQIMAGLPQSTFKDELCTAKQSKKLGAKEVRIYPVLVIKNTELAELWEKGDYSPLSEDDAINRCANLIIYLEANNIKVIRCGLHPSDGLAIGKDLLAGPFHVSFRQKVENRIFSDMLGHISSKYNPIKILYNPDDEASIFGYQNINDKPSPILSKGKNIARGALWIKLENRTFVFNRKKLLKITNDYPS